MVGGRLVWGGLVGGLVLGVLGLSLVSHISNISGVSISNGVGNDLDTAIGKVDTVLSVSGIAITGLVLLESSLAVVVSDGVGVLVLWGLIIVGLLVGSGLVSGSGLVRGGLVSRGGVISCGGSSGGGHEGSDGDEALKKENKHYINLNSTFLLV